jgi:hypothetical protein
MAVRRPVIRGGGWRGEAAGAAGRRWWKP